MIDLSTEQLLTLTQATKLLPGRRPGRGPSIQCVYRWSTYGCRGVFLETIQVGGTRCTSTEALQRFCERLSTGTARGASVTRRQREKQIRAAEIRLEQAGI